MSKHFTLGGLILFLLAALLVVRSNPDPDSERKEISVPAIDQSNTVILNAASRWNSEHGELIYSGQINEDLELLVQNHLDELKVLEITSFGGFSQVAKDITKALNERDVELIVSKYCISACAHYMVLPTKNVTVQPNSLIAFHHSDMSLGARFARTALMSKETYESEVKPITRSDIAFFKASGLNPHWLYLPDLFTGPICVEDRITRTVLGAPKLLYVNEFDFWVPNNQVLKSINPNIKVEGDFDLRATIEAANKSFPILGKYSYTTRSDLNEVTDDLDVWQKLPFCNSETIASKKVKEKSRRYTYIR